jgi:hypothetical protein
MGCDIHVYTEQYDPRDNTWYTNDNFRLNRFYGQFENQKESEHESVYHGRNYQLFGILAGVRDTYVYPIVSPRGIPDDSCELIKKEFAYWGGDAHTPSYFTLHELKEALIYSRPKSLSGIKTLTKFIDDIESKLRKDFFFYNWEDKEPDSQVNELIKNHRIVFWFDN